MGWAPNQENLRPLDVFEEIRRRLDCRDVAASLGLRVGNGYFECPDTNCPSLKKKKLAVTCPDGDTWTCCACALTGDAVDLLQEAKGLNKFDAVQEAKVRAGITDGKPLKDLPPPKRPKAKQIIIEPDELRLRFAVLTIATDHYDQLRRDGDDYLQNLGPMLDPQDRDKTVEHLVTARDYLNGRGIPPLMRLPVPVGVVPWWDTGLHARLLAEGGADMESAAFRVGILKRGRKRSFEVYRGRVWLPWFDAAGVNVVNVKGRAIKGLAEACKLQMSDDGKLSYPMHFLRTANTNPKLPPFTVRPTHPFGWSVAESIHAQKEIRDDSVPTFIVEGEIDAVSALLTGWPAIATGGTSGVGAKPLAKLIKDPALWVILFDGDPTGLKGAKKLAKATKVRWTTTPVGADVNEILRRNGPGALRAQLAAFADSATHHQQSTQEPIEQPVDLPEGADSFGMPPGWGMRGHMLCRVHVNKHGQEEWEETGLRNPPAIVWRGRDVKDHTVVVALAGNVVASGDRVEISLPRAKIKATREIVPALADHGFDVDSTTAKTLVRYLTDFEHAFGQRLPFKYGSRQMGWHGANFLYGKDCYGPGRLHYIGEEVGILGDLGTKGTMTGWREGVLRVMEKYPAAIFGLYTSLCGPVVQAVPGLSGFALEYAGTTSAGKSTVSAAVASAWGDSDEGGLMRPPYDTFASLELYAALMNNIPVFLEDSHLIEPKERARDLVMAWVNGQGKGRSKSGGTSRQEPRRWSTVVIITGEAPITRSTTYSGVGARVLSFPPPLPQCDDEDEKTLLMNDIKRMDSERVQHYGHAGRVWVQHLVNGGLARVLDAYHYWLPIIQGMANSDGPQQRWAKDFALITAVAQEAAPVLGGRRVEDKCLEIAVSYLRDTVSPDQANEAMELVLAWVAMDHAGGIEGDTATPETHQRKVWFRILDDGTVCVSVAELRAKLRDNSMHLGQLRKVWFERGWLMYNGKEIASQKIRLASGSTTCVPISPARANLDEVISHQRLALKQSLLH